MRVKWVLAGYGILCLIVALAFLPVGRIASGAVEAGWELFSELIFTVATIISIALLEAVATLMGPLARGARVGPISAPEAALALICIGVAVFAAAQLARKNLAPRARGIYAFFLLLALSIVAMVRFTMYSWAHFA